MRTGRWNLLWVMAMMVVLGGCEGAARMRAINYDNPTRDDIVALVHQAAGYARSHEREATLAAFMDSSTPFVHKDLYVFAFDKDGTVLADYGNSPLVGKNLYEFRDMKNHAVIQEMIETAYNGGGWVKTHWRNPVSTFVRPKDCYVLAVDDQMWIGVGLYE